jgi:uncharacterized integral membrane protein
MPLVVSSSITVWVMFHEATIHQFDLPTWTMVYAAASLTMAFALTPTTFVALLSGYFLGWQALIPVCVSYWLASWIGYVMAAKIDGGRLLNALEEKRGQRTSSESSKTGVQNHFASATFTCITFCGE